MTQTSVVVGCLSLGLGHLKYLLGVSLVKKEDILADSSGIKTQHSLWTIVQLALFEVVMISRSILFYRTAFLISNISVFNKDRLC